MAEDLDKREVEVLRNLIDIYVHEGIPVSSGRLKEAAGFALSSATIRNILAGLEEKGYVSKPHPSAGRIPTDEGYRFFVDTMEPNQRIFEELCARCRHELKEHLPEVGAIMSCASRLLGNISKNFAIVYGSVLRESRVRRINLFGLEGGRLLVVLSLEPEYEKTVLLRTGKCCSTAVLSRAESLINRLIEGKTLEEAKEALDNAVRDNVTEEGMITLQVAVNRETIFSGPPAVELYFEHKGRFFEQPELSDPALLKMLLRLLNDKDYLTSILSKRLEERTTITIGAENEEDALRPFSLVTSGYRMGGARGVLGIIGPTRMRYDLAFYLVGSIARELRALGEEYF